jgi:hypothetical protein
LLWIAVAAARIATQPPVVSHQPVP